ncbi:MAG: hypothetical protein INR65_17530 [Gluconacetobacter diazotrophicus]|nr:hypothetical protein [Gluconacetobacter diazotrophicus]
MAFSLRDKYLAGRTLTEELHYFSFPRTGSHFFVHCLNGLFDLITLPHEHLDNAEAISRQTELNPAALYALDLREEGAVYQPLFLNASAARHGPHGRPFAGERRSLILIRHPLPTLYSFYRVNRDRWGGGTTDLTAWLDAQLAAYEDYYSAAFEALSAMAGRALLVRYEELTAGAAALEEVVRFVGLKPKLSPEFVHWITGFERFARAETPDAPRTFYRAADPLAYAADPVWRELAAGLDPARWQRFGYGAAPAGHGQR